MNTPSISIEQMTYPYRVHLCKKEEEVRESGGLRFRSTGVVQPFHASCTTPGHERVGYRGDQVTRVVPGVALGV